MCLTLKPSLCFQTDCWTPVFSSLARWALICEQWSDSDPIPGLDNIIVRTQDNNLILSISRDCPWSVRDSGAPDSDWSTQITWPQYWPLIGWLWPPLIHGNPPQREHSVTRPSMKTWRTESGRDYRERPGEYFESTQKLRWTKNARF